VKRRKRRGTQPETGRRIGAERARAFQVRAGTTSRGTVLAEPGLRADLPKSRKTQGNRPLRGARQAWGTGSSLFGNKVKKGSQTVLPDGKPGPEELRLRRAAATEGACSGRSGQTFRDFGRKALVRRLGRKARVARPGRKAIVGRASIGTAEASAATGSRGMRGAPAPGETRRGEPEGDFGLRMDSQAGSTGSPVRKADAKGACSRRGPNRAERRPSLRSSRAGGREEASASTRRPDLRTKTACRPTSETGRGACGLRAHALDPEGTAGASAPTGPGSGSRLQPVRFEKPGRAERLRPT
jgi:hypothetical protein